MGNVCKEISDRVSLLSIDELKKTYAADTELLLYSQELYNPSILQMNPSFEIYSLHKKPENKKNSENIDQEVSYSFKYSDNKLQSYKAYLISFISVMTPTNPMFDVYNKRLQALCGIYEAFLRQEKLQEKLLASALIQKPFSSTLPVPAQIGLSFGITTLLIMLKRTAAVDAEILNEIITETTSILSLFKPMSCVVNDLVIEN